MRRLLTLAALLAALFWVPGESAFADDGSGCRSDSPYIEQIYGDTAR